MKIGFLGLGIMGQGMARNLALKGHDVTAWNRTTKAELKEKLPKVKLVSTIRDAVVNQEIVMICVTGPDAQKGIYYGDQGAFCPRDIRNIGSNIVFKLGNFSGPRWQNEVLRTDGIDNIIRRQAFCLQLVPIDVY